MDNNKAMPPNTIRPSVYRYNKGNLYEVIASVRHSETRAEFTLYRALYGERSLWVRPSAMFGKAVAMDGTSQTRFARVDAAA